MTKAVKLAQAAKTAAEVRAYQTDPDVVALRVERVRGWVDRLIWTGMTSGLVFTMANVAHFAAGDAKKWTLPWTTAWLLDPMVSLVLIGVLMGEQIINRHKLKAGGWVRTTKWVALTCTYAMNTWSAWSHLNPAQILLHSVPPAIVFCAAEAVVTIRQKITEAVTVAYDEAAERNAALEQARTALSAPTNDADRKAARAERPESARPTGELRTDTLRTEPSARELESARAESADRPVRRLARVSVSGASVDVDRAALVDELTDQIRDAVHAGEQWRPDYSELMDRTGFKRRWCEEVVRDAKLAVLSADDGEESAQAIDVRTPVPVPESAEDSARKESGPDAEGAESAPDADATAEPPAALALVGAGGERS
jgi:hypothetical protein